MATLGKPARLTGTACSQASTPVAVDWDARRRAADLPLGPIHAIVNPQWCMAAIVATVSKYRRRRHSVLCDWLNRRPTNDTTRYALSHTPLRRNSLMALGGVRDRLRFHGRTRASRTVSGPSSSDLNTTAANDTALSVTPGTPEYEATRMQRAAGDSGEYMLRTNAPVADALGFVSSNPSTLF